MLGGLLCSFFGATSRWCPWELGLIPRTSRVPTLCLYIRVNNHRVLKYLGIGESRHATMQIHTNMNHTVCASLLHLLHHSHCHSFDYLDPQFMWEHYFQQVMSQAILSAAFCVHLSLSESSESSETFLCHQCLSRFLVGDYLHQSEFSVGIYVFF